MKESERRYRLLVEESFDGLVVHDGNTILFANKRLHQMLGLEPGELIGKAPWDFIHPQDREWGFQRARDRLAGKKIPAQYEITLLTKDGRPLEVEIGARIVPSGDRPLDQVWVRDITERKRAMEKEREAEKKYRNLFENAIEGVFQSTLDGRFVTANPALARIYGYDSPQDLMESIKDISLDLYVDPSVRKTFLQEVLSKGYVKDFEVQVRRKDGSIAVTSVDAHVVRDHSGVVKHIEGFISDITHIIEKEKESEALEAQLRHAQKMEAVGTLAGGIAHDFNNSLQAILGFTEMLLFNRSPDDPDASKLRQIHEAAERAANLTHQLLTFSRRMESRPRPIDLNQEILRLIKLLRRTIPRMIEIEHHLAQDLHVINADPAQMEQVIMNISVNARDAMLEGGKLLFETKNVVIDDTSQRPYSWAEKGDYVHLSITDTGHGMDPETLEHIFEPFFTTKDVGKGTGLGLAMVYGIIKNHGGYITCSSEAGVGTTFDIYLPVFRKAHHDMVLDGPRKVPDDLPGGSETILLVDDDEAIRDLGSEILRSAGYSVLTASDGESALDTYEQEGGRIDLVLLDLIMPGIGGKKCLDEILSIDPKAKVIITSGYATDGHPQDALNKGASAFICKPYQMKELLRMVREVLDKDEKRTMGHHFNSTKGGGSA